ncbi:hypothetical protein [Streptomyces sp. NPDC048606]|uniref:hypothetical protein n=1 Tax=Streptomyces sp. NPDC048606 TaxID=3154726 RepID=UPI003435D904
MTVVDGGGNDGTAGDGAPDGGAVPPCPRCGRADRVTGVPAAHLEARATRREETDAGPDGRATVTTTRRDAALARALAPHPPEPENGGTACLGASLLFAAAGTFVWWLVAANRYHVAAARRAATAGLGDHPAPEAPLHPLVGTVSATAFALGLLAIGAFHISLASWRRRTRTGRAAADRVWSKGWYCARCGSVHHAEGPPSTLYEFRVRVWTAGGWAKSIPKHPLS